jgi:hypothetical protein
MKNYITHILKLYLSYMKLALAGMILASLSFVVYASVSSKNPIAMTIIVISFLAALLGSIHLLLWLLLYFIRDGFARMFIPPTKL